LAGYRAANAFARAVHGRFDPLGLTTERYDPIGRYHETDATGPIDQSSVLVTLGPDLDGPINGVGELGAKLAQGPPALRLRGAEPFDVHARSRRHRRHVRARWQTVKDTLASTESSATSTKRSLTRPLHQAGREVVEGTRMNRTIFAIGRTSHAARRRRRGRARIALAAAAGARSRRAAYALADRASPCGTTLESFFRPPAVPRNFTLGPITTALEPLQEPDGGRRRHHLPARFRLGRRSTRRRAHHHDDGKKFTNIPGTNAAGDPQPSTSSVTTRASTNTCSTSCRRSSCEHVIALDSVDRVPAFEHRFAVVQRSCRTRAATCRCSPRSTRASLFKRIFIGDNAGLSAAEIARKLDQEKSVLDRVTADLNRLKGLIPARRCRSSTRTSRHSRPGDVAAASGTSPTGGKMCPPPTEAALPAARLQTQDEAQHIKLAQNQLGIIQTAFQCDLTRVATLASLTATRDLRSRDGPSTSAGAPLTVSGSTDHLQE